ncbi:hypothetical protein DITRI_Ditri14bG0052100 [Diplodiscus trichospermus]
MDGSMASTEDWSSYLVDVPGHSNDQAEWAYPANNPQPVVQSVESAASIGQKRRRKPTLTPEDRKKRKNASDKNRRERQKETSDRLMNIARKWGGTDKIEPFLQRLEQMMSEHGGLEEIDSKLNILEQRKEESAVFEKVKTMFGGIHNILPGLDRLKKTEFQHSIFKPNQTEKSFIDFLPPSPDFPQDPHNHGALSVNSNSQGSISDWLEDYHPISRMELEVHTLYSDGLVTDFIAELEKKTRSKINFSSFKDLDGERQSIGDYSFPMSLVSTVKAITDAHGDITRNCSLGPGIIESAYVLLCAAIKEMGDLSLKKVTEETMLKWRDAIKDARQIDFNVEFAWEHLKKTAYAYFGFKARNSRTSLEQRKTKLMAEEKSLRQELEKNIQEVKAVEAKEEELTSQQCKMCQDCADRFLDKNVGLFG